MNLFGTYSVACCVRACLSAGDFASPRGVLMLLMCFCWPGWHASNHPLWPRMSAAIAAFFLCLVRYNSNDTGTGNNGSRVHAPFCVQQCCSSTLACYSPRCLSALGVQQRKHQFCHGDQQQAAGSKSFGISCRKRMRQPHMHARLDTAHGAQSNLVAMQYKLRAFSASRPSLQRHHYCAASESIASLNRLYYAAQSHICMFQTSSSDYTQQDHQHQQGQQEQRHPKQQDQQCSRWQKIQDMLQQYGPGAFFSYITFSNVVSVTMLSSAWLLYTKSTGCTPLQAGQWPKFLLFYAGAYAVTHVARPLKLAIGLSGTPIGSALVASVSKLLRCSTNAALVVLLVGEAVMLSCCLGAVVVYSATLAAATAAAVAAL